MPSPLIILGIALAISLAGNLLLGKLYVGAKQEVARVQQAYDSFVAQEKTLGEVAQKKADAQKADDDKRKRTADAENVATVARLNADIGKLRRERDSRSGGNILSSAPSGSGCPANQACFDRAGLESALRDYRTEIRGLADQAAALEADLNTARKWAQR